MYGNKWERWWKAIAEGLICTCRRVPGGGGVYGRAHLRLSRRKRYNMIGVGRQGGWVVELWIKVVGRGSRGKEENDSPGVVSSG